MLKQNEVGTFWSRILRFLDLNDTCHSTKIINTYLTTVFNSEAALTVMMAMNFETEENPI